MAVASKQASYLTQTQPERLVAFWQKLLGMVKLGKFFSPQKPTQSRQQSQPLAEPAVTGDKFFSIPEKDRSLIKDAVTSIKDPAIKAQFKLTLRKILTDAAITTDKRLKKLRFGMLQLAKYLIKIGEIKAAEHLVLKLNFPELTTDDLSVVPAKNLSNLRLDYQLTQMLLAWQLQNQVWLANTASTAPMTNMLNMLRSSEQVQFAAEVLADKQKVLLPIFARHCAEQEPLVALTAHADSRPSMLSAPILQLAAATDPESQVDPAPASLTFSTVTAQSAAVEVEAAKAEMANVDIAEPIAASLRLPRPRALAGA